MNELGSIEVGSNPKLQNLKGLENIKYIGEDLTIRHNTELLSLEGLENITFCNLIEIKDNDFLASLKGLDKLESSYEIKISQNPKLSSLRHLNNLESSNSISISGTIINSLVGLNKLESVSNLFEISNNKNLKSLQGIENLKFSKKIDINHDSLDKNPLKNYCGLLPFLEENNFDTSLLTFLPPDYDNFKKGNLCISTTEDDDNDGVTNDLDICPNTPTGVFVTEDGCPLPDSDGDGIEDSIDLCPETIEGEVVDGNGCSNNQRDDDGDGVVNKIDVCPNTPLNSLVNIEGCLVLDNNNFAINTIGETCIDKNNGKISIKAIEDYNYVATIDDNTSYDFTNKEVFFIENLATGKHKLCLEIKEQAVVHCYNLTIPKLLPLTSTTNSTKTDTSIEILTGTPPFNIYVNGNFESSSNSNNIEIDTKNKDVITIESALPCEGKIHQTIVKNTEPFISSNFGDTYQFLIPNSERKTIKVKVYNSYSQLIEYKKYTIINDQIELSLKNHPSGIYFVEIINQESTHFKVIKN